MARAQKRKQSVLAHATVTNSHSISEDLPKPGAKKRATKNISKAPNFPEHNAIDFLDGAQAPAASPDTISDDEKINKGKPDPSKATTEQDVTDQEETEDEGAGDEDIKADASRPPPSNSDYLPLPWKGRLGYACLNTYLRYSRPSVFSSRTCRIASILENRYPLANSDKPPHPTKNRRDKDQPPDVARGQAYVEGIGLANAEDIVKMIRWNDKYGIKFLRLSSEMFPFASHAAYGYRLEPFAAAALAAAGCVAAELGHRLTTHPGQFTQLGSPRKEVIDASIRDLGYHAELLSLLKLPSQQDRDAVMILHLGGVFGDKGETLNRFRKNYSKLALGIKKRLVLENDDVSWSVHDLLPICEELNIPLVLDYHHNNIIFDSSQMREGTKDIMELYPRILATWKRKNITPKMHYSEPTSAAITGHQRRKHSARVATLPPCPPDMDLMIEAKDKEQAVFEHMRTFKLPGFDTFANLIPHVRNDENLPIKTSVKKLNKRNDQHEDAAISSIDERSNMIPDDEVGMGGPDGRVYWPPGMEEWLRPAKRVVKPKNPVVKGALRVKTETRTKAELVSAIDTGEPELVNTALPFPQNESKREKLPTNPRNQPSTKIKLNPFLETTEGEGDMDLSGTPVAEKSHDAPTAPATTRTSRSRMHRQAKHINYAE